MGKASLARQPANATGSTHRLHEADLDRKRGVELGWPKINEVAIIGKR